MLIFNKIVSKIIKQQKTIKILNIIQLNIKIKIIKKLVKAKKLVIKVNLKIKKMI